MTMVTKLATVVTYHKEFLPKICTTPQLGSLRKSRDKLNIYISTCREPMDTKLGQRLTYH